MNLPNDFVQENSKCSNILFFLHFQSTTDRKHFTSVTLIKFKMNRSAKSFLVELIFFHKSCSELYTLNPQHFV